MELTDREFGRIVSYMQSRYGIDLSAKRVLITGRLENYLLREGYQSYDEYLRLVENNPSGEQAKNLINVLTTNHTYFMREFEHMDFLRTVILPWLKEKEKTRGKDIRIWSAASSTGEEPYTIQMVLQDFFAMEPGWDTQILATDLSTRVLLKAKAGIYLKEQLEPLPDSWKRRYFKAVNQDQYQAVPSLRNKIVFKQFNLMDEIPFRGLFHVVFLRNVMIYFDEETKRKLLNRIYKHMANGAYLFIGTTESIDKNALKFKYVRPSIYRKAEEGMGL